MWTNINKMKPLKGICIATVLAFTGCDSSVPEAPEIESKPWLSAKIEDGHLYVEGQWPASVGEDTLVGLTAAYPNGVIFKVKRAASWTEPSPVAEVFQTLSELESADILAYGDVTSVLSEDSWNTARVALSLTRKNQNIAFMSPNVFWHDSKYFVNGYESCQALFDHLSYSHGTRSGLNIKSVRATVARLIDLCGRPESISIIPRPGQIRASAAIDAQPWLVVFDAPVSETELNPRELPAPLAALAKHGHGPLRFNLAAE